MADRAWTFAVGVLVTTAGMTQAFLFLIGRLTAESAESPHYGAEIVVGLTATVVGCVLMATALVGASPAVVAAVELCAAVIVVVAMAIAVSADYNPAVIVITGVVLVGLLVLAVLRTLALRPFSRD